MFKKLADLFFEDVEVEEEEIVLQTVEAKPIKVKQKPVQEPSKINEVPNIPAVKPEVEELEQKTFVEPKEKSIFINNTVVPKKKEEKKKTQSETERENYRFTPIISPIRGLKNPGEDEYEVAIPKMDEKTQKKVSHLGTVISPIHGIPKDEMPDLELEQSNSQLEDKKENLELESDKELLNNQVLKTQFVNMTLEDLLQDDSQEVIKDKVHFFIGIKGTGMSALANLLHDAGVKVMGSDTTNYVFTETELLEKGIELVPFGSGLITEDMVIVKGNSFYPDHVDVVQAHDVQAKIYDYPEYLGKFIQDYTSIAVSGSHGKTTTTSMISDMLRTNMPTAHLIGDGRGHVDEGSHVMVIEACEYKRHFLEYKADYAVITNLEWDHVDYYHTVEDYISAFEEFANQIKNTVFVFGDDPYAKDLKVSKNVLFYGESESNDLYAKNIIELESGSSFDIVYKGEDLGEFRINRTGRHMIHNAIAAIGIGLLLGLDKDSINAGLSDYQGARRRFEVTELGDSVVIDDYAHHPTEIAVTLDAARVRYPNHQIVAVYHPDRIKRLEAFQDEFIEALNTADYTAIGSAVDSDGMTAVIDTTVLTDNVKNSFNVNDDQESVEKLAILTPAAYVFMGTKEMHHLKVGLIDYLKKIDI